MRKLLRGRRICIDALRGARTNPLLPFTVRGLAGGRSRAFFAAWMLALVAAAIVAEWAGSQLRFLAISRFYAAFPPTFAATVAFSAITAAPVVLLHWTFVLSLAGGRAARRWIAGRDFRRDVRVLPEAAVPLCGALLALAIGAAITCHVGAVLGGSAVGLSGPSMGSSGLAQSWSMKNYLRMLGLGQSDPGTFHAVALLEVLGQAAALLRAAARVVACFAILVSARRLRTGLLVCTIVLWSDAVILDIAREGSLFVLVRTLPVPDFLPVLLLVNDLFVTPAAALAWGALAFAAAARLERRLEGELAPQEAAGE